MSPLIERRCARCKGKRAFESTCSFRVNGNGRKLDVWLIYACTRCGFRWNLTVHTRVSPESLGERLVRYEDNDPELAREVARDRGILKAARARILRR